MTKLAALALTLLTGCSLVFMETVPDKWAPPKQLHCTATGGWVAWDILIGVSYGVTSAMFFARASDEENPAKVRNNSYLGSALAAGGAAVYFASAVAGQGRVNDCKAARRRADAAVPVKRPTDELEQLKARVRELEQKAAPPVTDAPPDAFE